jgi:NAD(P)H-hydrate epimerase
MTNTLPTDIFLSEQVREIDRSAIVDHGVDGFELMQAAARFSFHTLIKKQPSVRHLIVLCGSGNNAGDGYIIAAIAKKRRLLVSVLYLCDPEKLSGDAQKAYQLCIDQQVNCQAYGSSIFAELISQQPKHGSTPSQKEQSVIIDALLGTGLNAEVKGSYLDAINQANRGALPILSIDIPSGLCANSGDVLGAAIEANWTVTFIALKLGLLTGTGKRCAGELYYDSLDVAKTIIDQAKPIATRLTLASLLTSIKPRKADTHKGQCGHTLIIGGDTGFGGAVIMAAEAAARVGSGLTTVVTHQANHTALLARCPEVMVKAVNSTEQLVDLIHLADVVVVGPGLGKSAWAEKMVFTTVNANKPIIFDADALNLLSAHPDWTDNLTKILKNKRIYTPHPVEAARLLAITAQEVQKDRLGTIQALQAKLEGHTLLKGSGSLMIHPNNRVSLCPYGNPGMASGGMGDVLSGIIAGLVAQGVSLTLSLELAVCLHAYAADLSANEHGERGLLASDLIPTVRALLNKK